MRISKSTEDTEAVPKTSVAKSEPAPKILLATSPTDPIGALDQALILIYGENKIGKTSIASCFPDPIFLMFEPGARGLRITSNSITTWSEFVSLVKQLQKTDRFRTIICDPISKAYRMVVDHVCQREGVSDPRDVPWGNGWKAINDEFDKQIDLITSKGRGVVFLEKPEMVKFERRTGGEYNRISARMMKHARDHIYDICDIIAFYGYWGDKRYLTLKGSDELDAGNRLKYNFKTPEGVPIHSIPMFDDDYPDFNEEDAYNNLIEAFENRQTTVSQPGHDGPSFLVPAKKDTKKGKR